MVETLVAITVLLLAIVGVVGVILSSKNVNDMARYQVIAKETAQAEIERVKLIGYHGVTPGNLTGIGYVAFGQLDKIYTFTGTPSAQADVPYKWVVFKGMDVTRTIKGQTRHYYYTLKLECEGKRLRTDPDEDDFVPGVAKRLRMRAYWLFNGRLKHIEVIFVVGKR